MSVKTPQDQSGTLKQQILDQNQRVHQIEAPIYDLIHTEIFNRYEQAQIRNDLKLIDQHLKLSKPHVLDVGCGTGNLTRRYLARDYTVTALDISEEMIDALTRSVPSEAVLEAVVSDVDRFFEALPPEQTFDLISFSSVLHHLPDYVQTFQNVLRRLKSGGIVYVIHEPTMHKKNVEPGLILRVLKGLDLVYQLSHRALAYLLYFVKTRHLITHIDYSLSDYHAASGLDHQFLLTLAEGYQVLKLREYTTASIPWIARYLNNRPASPVTNFSFILRKP